ncbi:helix-turn-helix domain-containing protein [Pseudonocardia alaniniphila]|uniref:AraC family transcriptional regulator n=1 Tax=Pseudonocardia alaniniphila TaxID=75291 RepID=A0ABS9TFF0_9PSEU|nr:AraC family transcriptional regulator [Pseudonocardia alaniniphila]MCH6167261.1 AraC family transcriptional regulator [Pseudonocardia alaniniphila]
MQILEFSGEELEDAAGAFSIPVIARTAPGFRGRAASQELGETLTLTRTHWGQMSSVRTDRMAARTSADDLMLFCIYVAGRGCVRQHDRCAELAAGAGVLTEARNRYERISPTETWRTSMRFSRELLPLRTAELTEGCARSMDPSAPAMRMLSAYLDRLFEVADELTTPQRLDAGRAAIEMLAMALRGVTPSVPGGDGPEGLLLEMMRTHVREHLTDPHLRVEELARRHHVSVSHAYTLFERIGTTPGAYLREERLLAAQAMLSGREHDRRTISAISAAAGFLDLRTFERAFRRRFGTTPSSWRSEHLHAGPAPRR